MQYSGLGRPKDDGLNIFRELENIWLVPDNAGHGKHLAGSLHMRQLIICKRMNPPRARFLTPPSYLQQNESMDRFQCTYLFFQQMAARAKLSLYLCYCQPLWHFTIVHQHFSGMALYYLPFTRNNHKPLRMNVYYILDIQISICIMG